MHQILKIYTNNLIFSTEKQGYNANAEIVSGGK